MYIASIYTEIRPVQYIHTETLRQLNMWVIGKYLHSNRTLAYVYTYIAREHLTVCINRACSRTFSICTIIVVQLTKRRSSKSLDLKRRSPHCYAKSEAAPRRLKIILAIEVREETLWFLALGANAFYA